MKKLLRRLVLLGALAGAVYAARSYLQRHSPGKETVQIVFDDGSTRSLASNTTEGNEFIDTAQKIVDIGL
ncbi:MAG: hypothetical protein H0U55_16565 [Rubrobacteraceae bacterium]|nr:hypothetical protein [Rubrobacteraceae bacterium]